jgi:hypothetical protein
MATLRTTMSGMSRLISERINNAHESMKHELATLPIRMAEKHEAERQERLVKEQAEAIKLKKQMQNPEFAAAFDKHMLTIRAALDK